MGSKAASRLLSVDFEVFGKVQGVFFRKWTREQGRTLGLRGWCMNTEYGTVKGNLEGEASKVEEMKKWLETKGSPSSVILKAEFKNEKEIKEYSCSEFVIRY